MANKEPNLVEALADQFPKRRFSIRTPFSNMAEVLAAVALDSRLTDSEFDEIERRTVQRLVKVQISQHDAVT